MKIAIIGATSFVGSQLLKEALGRGHQVTVIVRDAAKIKSTHPNLFVQQGDVSRQEELSYWY
jgi:putative NADH-flavin reductase